MMTGTRRSFRSGIGASPGAHPGDRQPGGCRDCTGLQALVEDNADLAREVIARDVELNRLRYDIEEECYHLLVTEQPVAGDMRAIISGVIIASELERIADHGKKIAGTYLRMLDDPRMVPLGDVPRLGEMALDLVERALRSIAHRDVEEARAVCLADDQVDALYKQTFNLTISYMLENPRQIARRASDRRRA